MTRTVVRSSGSVQRSRHCLAIAIATALLIAGCGKKQEEETAPVVTVDVAPVLSAQIQRTIRAGALVYPSQQAAIVPKITAPIKKFYVQKGEKVRAGQLLVELENADLAGAAHESEAAFQGAQATYETTARATVPQEAQKEELDVQSAKTAMDAAQAVYESRQRLFREGAIAQKDVNEAQVNFTQARNQYEMAQKHLNDLQSFGNDQAIKAATAQRDQAKAHQDAAVAQLGYSRITSPIDGVVTDRPLYAGETPPSGTPIVTVMDLSHVVARAHIAPAEAAELKVGDAANLIGPDNTPIAGEVTQISPALDPANTTVEVWVQADNPGDRLKPGTSIRVELIARTVPNALVIPQAALLTSGSGTTSVVVIDAENKPHRKSVTTGIRDAGAVQVTDGLESGQRVVTTGAFELAKLDADVLAKTKVQIQPPKEEEEEEDTP
jgi:multidrug efflux pump subunit AcrA (membrane-fusion protein)